MVFKKITAFLSFFILALTANAAEIVEYKEIHADKVNYNLKSGDIKTSGKTEVVAKTGQKMTLFDANLSEKNAAGKGISIEWNEHTLITADVMKKEGDLTEAKKVSYTACNNCDQIGAAWTVHAADMTHDAVEKNMYFYDFWFDIYGLPVLYLPYMSQPDPTVKYRSGLLLPDFGSTTNMGTQLNIPLYLNFSDSHDLTVTGAFLTKENPVLMAEHRLILDHAKFETNGSFTSTRDRLNRWHLFHNDMIDLGENMRLSASIHRTSDKTYLQQYGFYGNQPFLESGATLEVFSERGYMTVGANMFQELRQELQSGSAIVPKGDIVPKIHGTYQVGLTDNLYSRFTGDFMRISDSRNDSSMNRALGEVRLIAPVEAMWQKFTVSAATRSDYYQYNNMGGMQAEQGKAHVKDTSRVLSSGYVDWEMPFVKNSDGWTQIIKPKARVTVIGKSDGTGFLNLDSTGALLSDMSLFANNRYSGYDMWVNGTYADYGVLWTGYNSEGRGTEVFIGQTYDFDVDAESDINSGYHKGASDVVGRVGFNLTEWLNVMNRFRVGKSDWSLRHLETDVRIGGRNYISIGYIWTVQLLAANDAYVDDIDISEVVIGTGLHLTDRLVFKAGGIYNFTNGIAQRYSAGFYYEHPCYTLGFAYDVDNALKRAGANGELDFYGVSTLKFKFSIKMGK
ncbi:MAG: LPS assembly protein LptD [Rickettsiales bacterium]|jgi:LPS-assembly protein|nr:LPS assembly protein LptD [Rickettsiales bacterium]